MDNLNEAKKTPCIPMLPSLGKKYSNFEAYLHSRIGKNHYLYNEKLLNNATTANQSDESLLDGIIQCKTLLDSNHQPHTQFESNSKLSISLTANTRDPASNPKLNRDATSLGLENLSSNSRHTINTNNTSSRNNVNNNNKLAEINTEHEEKSNSVKSNSNNNNNNNRCSNNYKPLNNNNISLDLEITTTKNIRNFNNNYSNISNSKLNRSCSAINSDLFNTTISHNNNNITNMSTNNNNESKHELKNLINNYSIEFDLPSNMLILSGKNYLNSCQINPNKNATNSIGRNNNKKKNEFHDLVEGASKQDAASDNDVDENDDVHAEDEQDKYLNNNNKLEENNKQEKLNANISKLSSEFLYTSQNLSNNLDNRKIILDLKNALRSYCFKYSRKQKSLENFNTKIRNFNRIQMTKRRNELKSSSNKEKLERTNFRKQSIMGENTGMMMERRRRLSADQSIATRTATLKEDEFEEIEEEILNAGDDEEEEEFNEENIYYYENELDDDEREEQAYVDEYIDEQLSKEYDEMYDDQLVASSFKLNESEMSGKKEPKISKINIEFFNRFKKNKQNSKCSKKQQQQLNNTPKQQQLVTNEETDTCTLASKIKLKANLDCEKSLDTFAIVNSSTKPKSKKNKNRKTTEENSSSSSTTLITANNNNNTSVETQQKDELNKTNKHHKSKSKKHIHKTKTKESLLNTARSTAAATLTARTESSSSSFSTSAKSENKAPLFSFNDNQKQLNEETNNNSNNCRYYYYANNTNNTTTHFDQLELDEEILKIEETEINLNKNNESNHNSNNNNSSNKINETNSRNSSNRSKLELESKNQSSEKRKFACTPPPTTIPSKINEQQSNELNNSLNNLSSNNSKNYNNSNYNNNNIKHVYEKTSLLVRNLYKNFDLLKETQDLSEQIVSSKMYSSSTSTTPATSTTTPGVQQQQQQQQQKLTKQQTKNTLLTNSTSNLLINTAVGLNSTQQISPTSSLPLPPHIQQPHWVNIATVNAKSNVNTKLLSNDTQSAIYLYSEMPLITSKQASRGQNRNRKNNKLFHFRNGIQIEDASLAVSPVRTTGEAKLLKLASMQQQQQQQQQQLSTNNKQIILLKRDKAGKLIPIEATATTSFKQQHSMQRNIEEAYLTEDQAETASNLNLNDYLKLPNLMKTKLSIEQLSKQTTSSSNMNSNRDMNRDPNYVLAQMTKYQRQNAINFLKLTNKTLADQITSKSSLSSFTNNFINNNNLIRTLEAKPTSPTPSATVIPTTAPVSTTTTLHTPILVRGNSFVAAKDVSNQILTQQTQLNTLNQQNLTKPKLSQIKFKSKNRPILISSISDFNLINNNSNLSNLTATLLPPSLELISVTTSASNTSNDDSNDTVNNQSNSDLVSETIQTSSAKQETDEPPIQSVELNQNESQESVVNTSPTLPAAAAVTPTNEDLKHGKNQTSGNNNKIKKFNLMDIEPTLNKCRGLYTYAATSSSQLKDAAFFSNNMKKTRSSVNYLNYNTEALLTNSTEDIITSLLVTQQKSSSTNSNSKNATSEIVTPIKIKNTSNNRQIFKDLEFIYNEQQVIKLQRQILIQIRQQNKLKERMQQQQPTQQQDDDEEDDENEETNRGLTKPDSSTNYRNLNSNYSYEYDVYKFYERNKTSLLLSSLQQQSKLRASATHSSNTTSSSKAITKSTVNLNENQEDNLDEEEEIENESREDENEELVDNSQRNLLDKRVKCES